MRNSEKVMVATLLVILLPTTFFIGFILNKPDQDDEGWLIPFERRFYIYQSANGTYYVFSCGIDVRLFRWNGTDWVELEYEEIS